VKLPSGLRRAVLIAAAAALALAPLPRPLVERWYSRGIYPACQRLLTSASNLAPFALFDVLLIAIAAWLVWRLAGDVALHRRVGWPRAGLGIALRLLATAAAVYLVFLAAWGLNYQRAALQDRLEFDARLVTPGRARDLADVAVDRVNALYGAAHAAGPGINVVDIVDMASLAVAFADAERVLGVAHPATPARPKHSWLNPYFRAAAVDGMTDPFLLETLVVSDLLPVETPLVVAHEWGHLAGFADEGEANFIGWLTCVRGSNSEQYSGWLFLYGEMAGGLRRDDRSAVAARLAPGPRDDLRAIADRIRGHVNPRVSAAGWHVYDRYLKANRVEAGAASYAEIVRLILGTRFDQNWTPTLRF
jgi:hypothetical protein